MLFLTGSLHLLKNEIEAQRELIRHGAGCYRKGPLGSYSVFFFSDRPRIHLQIPWLGNEGDVYVGCKKPDPDALNYKHYMNLRNGV